MNLKKRFMSSIALLALAALPAAELSAGGPIAEVGQLDRVTLEWQRLPLSRRYDDLVVVAQPASYNSPAVTIARLDRPKTLYPTARVRLEQSDDGSAVDLRGETVSYLAAEAGAWALDGGGRLGAGTTVVPWPEIFSTDGPGMKWTTVELPPLFAEPPVVLAQVQAIQAPYDSDQAPRLVTARTRNVTRKSFEMALQAQYPARPDLESRVVVGWLAISPDVVAWSGHAVRAGTEVAPDYRTAPGPPWVGIYFGERVFRQPPRFLASLAGDRDTRSAHLRYDRLTVRSAAVLIESPDTPQHGVEDVHYLAIEGAGALTGDPARTLFVDLAGTGGGRVILEPPGIACGADCLEAYADGTAVTLDATASADSIFKGWSGDCESKDLNEVIMVMDRDRRCVANFELVPRLEVELAGAGSGTVTSMPVGIDCPGDCSEEYSYGDGVRLSATPDAGSVLAGWSGDGCADGKVTMNAHRDCTATFEIGEVYTADQDFDQGRLFNVNYQTSDQLRVDEEIRPHPYIWIAASARGTIVKIDTFTGVRLGEYSTSPDNLPDTTSHNPDPSRTTVALDGSVWAGNRKDASVIHVGLVEEGQCVDRNGNGTIETSTRYGDGHMLPWPNLGGEDDQGGVSTAQDECILHYVKVASTRPRHVSIDLDGNVWVSGHGGAVQRVFDQIDGQTGEILSSVGPLDCGGYGGFIDRDGVLWSQQPESAPGQANGRTLRWDLSLDPSTAQCLTYTKTGYGIALGNDDYVYVASHCEDKIWKIDRHTGTLVKTITDRRIPCVQGLAVDEREHLWLSSSRWAWSGNGDTKVGHMTGDGLFVGIIGGAPRGSTGVAVDSAGKIWLAAYHANQAFRIDPNDGAIGGGDHLIGKIDKWVGMGGITKPQPYNYSDMTGWQALRNSDPRGTWTVVQDGGAAGLHWGAVEWNRERQGAVPPGTSITVEVRVADAIGGLGGQPFAPVTNGVPFSAVGRYIEVRAVLRPGADGVSPILSDLEIRTSTPAARPSR